MDLSNVTRPPALAGQAGDEFTDTGISGGAGPVQERVLEVRIYACSYCLIIVWSLCVCCIVLCCVMCCVVLCVFGFWIFVWALFISFNSPWTFPAAHRQHSPTLLLFCFLQRWSGGPLDGPLETLGGSVSRVSKTTPYSFASSFLLTAVCMFEAAASFCYIILLLFQTPHTKILFPHYFSPFLFFKPYLEQRGKGWSAEEMFDKNAREHGVYTTYNEEEYTYVFFFSFFLSFFCFASCEKAEKWKPLVMQLWWRYFHNCSIFILNTILKKKKKKLIYLFIFFYPQNKAGQERARLRTEESARGALGRRNWTGFVPHWPQGQRRVWRGI